MANAYKKQYEKINLNRDFFFRFIYTDLIINRF